MPLREYRRQHPGTLAHQRNGFRGDMNVDVVRNSLAQQPVSRPVRKVCVMASPDQITLHGWELAHRFDRL
jgi:hypothetical protein